MKKALVYTMTLCALMLGFTACNDDHDAHTDSRLTTYAKFEMLGSEFTEVNLGEPYVDAGCKATLGGEDCTSRIVTTGLDEIDTDVAGFYYIKYAVTNDDGFTTSVTRTVAVFDPTVTTDLSGDYTVQPGSYRYWFSTGGVVNFSGFSIKLEKVLPGIFSVSDLMGGYYDQGVGYGSNYAMAGTLQLTADNQIIIISGSVPGWGDSFDEAYVGEYNPEDGSVTWGIDYAGSMYFEIIIKPETEE